MEISDLDQLDTVGKRCRACVDGIENAYRRKEPQYIEKYFLLFCEVTHGRFSIFEFYKRVKSYFPNQYMELMVRLFKLPRKSHERFTIGYHRNPLEAVPLFISHLGYHIRLIKPELYSEFITSGISLFNNPN